MTIKEYDIQVALGTMEIRFTQRVKLGRFSSNDNLIMHLNNTEYHIEDYPWIRVLYKGLRKTLIEEGVLTNE